MKTALEILEDHDRGNGSVGIAMAVEAMKLYAEQAIDEAAKQSQEMIYEINGDKPLNSLGLTIRNFQSCYAVPKQSILKIKEELK